MNFILNTPRLRIRKLLPSDWAQMKWLDHDFSNSKYAVYDGPFPDTDEEIQKLTARFAESGLFFGILLPDRDGIIGYVCFHASEGIFDLGYLFHSDYQGKGYAIESCRALMDYMSAHYPVRQFTAGTALDNTPSCKLLDKLGFVCTGTEILSFHQDKDGNDIRFVGGLFRKEI